MYSDRSGTLEIVFDSNDTLPGKSGPAIGFFDSKLNDGVIGTLTGISNNDCGHDKIDPNNLLEAIVTNQTVIPGSVDMFASFSTFDFDNSIFVFGHQDPLASGTSLYLRDAMGITPLIVAGEMFDGQNVLSATNPVSLGNGAFLVSARLGTNQNSTAALYKVQFLTAVPEPSSLACLGAVTLAMFIRRTRSSRRNQKVLG